MNKAKNIKPKVIEASEDDSESDVPVIAVKPTKKEKVEEKKVTKKVPVKQESSEEQDTPVVEKKPTKQAKVEVAPAKKVVPVAKKPAKKESSEEESEQEAPKKVAVKVKSPVQKAVVQKKKAPEPSSEESEEEAPKVQPKKVQKVASPVQKPVAKKVVQPASDSEESEEEKPVKKTVKSPVVKAKSPAQKPVQKKAPVESSEQSSEEAKPVAKKPVAKVVAKKAVQPASDSDEESEEQKPVVAKKGAKVAAKPKQSSSDESEKPAPKKAVSPKPVVAAKPVAKKQPEPEPIVNEDDQQGVFEVCVRGLSFQAYDSDIRDFFSECGNVTEVKLLTRDDGKSKGTAFVKFSKKSSFNKAVELNGSEHLGRSLTIEESQKKNFNNGGSFGQKGGFGNSRPSFGGAPQGNANIETPTLFIGGLSYNSTADSISSFFSQIGEVSSARVVTDKQTGKPRGFGYIEFHDVDTAKKAYAELNGANLDGRSIRLDSASQRDRPPQGGFQQGGYQQGGFQRGGSRNPGNSTVVLSQDDKNAKKGSIGSFAGKKVLL